QQLLISVCQGCDFFERPHVIRHAGSHRWRHAQRLMDAAKVVYMTRYLRGEYTRDPQGRTVRKHHAVIYIEQSADGPKKRSRWYEIYEAPAKHMRASLALRRRAAPADVAQLNLDLESYNENNYRGETV
ncbi:MAG: hypothetical protein WD944_10320, partial [Steroidobacteraceae bacterium]